MIHQKSNIYDSRDFGMLSGHPGFLKILSEIAIDDYRFRATKNPLETEGCVLWILKKNRDSKYRILGSFSRFDKRDILFFVSRYVTSRRLRDEIETRKFEQTLEGHTKDFFADIEKQSQSDRTGAYLGLFNLDDQIDPQALAMRRRIMARRFHPDCGGDNETMSLINQAYQHLMQTSCENRQ